MSYIDFMHCDGYAVVYDVADRKSFEYAKRILEGIYECKTDQQEVIVVANITKHFVDPFSEVSEQPKREITFHEGMKLAQYYSASFYEVDSENIDACQAIFKLFENYPISNMVRI